MYGLGAFVALLATASIARAHTVITYPGWRGNNLHTNGTLPEDNPDALGITYSENGTTSFPWGQQWIYPCKRSRSHDQSPAVNDRLTSRSQVAACLNRQIAPSGQSTAAVSPSSRAGSRATVSPCSTSTSESTSLGTLRLETCHTRLSHRSSS
jgi:hypothetical protein